jgi:hypothetical protein
LTRGLDSRAFILAGTYASVFMLGWPVLALALLGLIDSIFHLRARVAARRGPPNVRT